MPDMRRTRTSRTSRTTVHRPAVLAACRPTIRSSLLPPYCRRKSALHEGNPGEEPGPPHPSSPRSRPLHIPAAASVLKDKPSKGGRDATVELGGGDAAGGPGGHRHRRRGVPRRVRPRAGGERAGDPDRARGRPTGVLPLRAVPVPAVHHRDLLADPGGLLGPVLAWTGPVGIGPRGPRRV